jgi:hypothetical protein
MGACVDSKWSDWEHGEFYITNAKHKIELIAGDGYDGYVRMQPHQSRSNAKWKFNAIAGKPDTYHITNVKHGKEIVGRATSSTDLLHKAHGGVPMSEWKLIPASTYSEINTKPQYTGSFFLINTGNSSALMTPATNNGTALLSVHNWALNAMWFINPVA